MAKRGTKKNAYEIGKGKPPKHTQFSKNRQPDSKQLKEGWSRRQNAQKIMDKFLLYSEMDMETFMKKMNDMQKNPGEYTVADFVAVKYVSKTTKQDKFMLDWIDRHVPKAPQEVENTGELKIKITREILDDPSI